MQRIPCKNKIVAVIPCYNEQASIRRVVLGALTSVTEVIVINDGSVDRTEEEAKKAGALVISHPKNRGKGAALKTAFEFLRQMQFEAAVLLDGDGQHDPVEIEKLVEPIIAGKADMVIGSRYLQGADKIPFYRRIGQRVLNFVSNQVSGVWVTDSQSGYRSFSYRAVREMELREKGFSVESEMQIIAGRKGLKVAEIPISTIYEGRAKRNPFAHGFSVLFRVLLFAGRE
jgi:glycosyltransferase involved in cell wall biosynthesis